MITSIDVQQAVTDAARKRRAQVLTLVDDEKLTVKQVCGITGLSRQRVHAMLKQARKDKSAKR